MTATPWGDADRLHERRLPPGPGRTREEVRANQRERLFAATVAVVADKGYEATRVEDILQTAGVSRNAFYKQFSSKLDCFVATLREIARLAEPILADAIRRSPDTWEDRLKAMLDALAANVVAQPAMARVAWVEYYAAGPEAIEIVEGLDSSIERVVRRELRRSPAHAGMPRDLVRAIVGGLRKLVQTRVHENRVDELPELMPWLFDWMRGYDKPPVRLRRPRRVPPELVPVRAEPRDARERILAAVTEIVTEKGYQEMAITEIAARAGVSLTTFYQHFEGKEAAFLTSLDVAQREVFQRTVSYFSTAPDWPTAVSIGGRAFAAFIATHPAVAKMGNVEVWSTTPAGFELRERGMTLFRALLDEGLRQYPTGNPITAEAVGASIDALLFSWLRHEGSERLYELLPTTLFLALTPFVGAERACQIANGDPFAAPDVARR